jgi:hypothetical protein
LPKRPTHICGACNFPCLKKNNCAKIQPMAPLFFPSLFHFPRLSFSAPASHSFQKRLKKSDFYSSASLLPPHSSISNHQSILSLFPLFFLRVPLPALCRRHTCVRLPRAFQRGRVWKSFVPQKRIFVSPPNMLFVREIPHCSPRYGGEIIRSSFRFFQCGQSRCTQHLKN